MQTPGAGVCPRCGEWSEPWAVSAAERKMACPGCGYEAPFLRLPLFVITGASGSGKTAMGERLVPELRGKCVVLDRDLLWREEFREKLEAFNSLWLRIARQVAQAGLPVLMYGTTLPEHIEGLGERVYFSEVHYLALTCSDAELVARLEGRPAWRGSASPEFVGKMREFNAWIRSNAAVTRPPMTLLDTSTLSPDEATARAAAWVRERLKQAHPVATG